MAEQEMVTRDQVAAVMSNPLKITGDTPAKRNDQRRVAVAELLRGTQNPMWTQGRAHDMIMDDLDTYEEWEKEDAG